MWNIISKKKIKKNDTHGNLLSKILSPCIMGNTTAISTLLTHDGYTYFAIVSKKLLSLCFCPQARRLMVLMSASRSAREREERERRERREEREEREERERRERSEREEREKRERRERRERVRERERQERQETRWIKIRTEK